MKKVRFHRKRTFLFFILSFLVNEMYNVLKWEEVSNAGYCCEDDWLVSKAADRVYHDYKLFLLAAPKEIFCCAAKDQICCFASCPQ